MINLLKVKRIFGKLNKNKNILHHMKAIFTGSKEDYDVFIDAMATDILRNKRATPAGQLKTVIVDTLREFIKLIKL